MLVITTGEWHQFLNEIIESRRRVASPVSIQKNKISLNYYLFMNNTFIPFQPNKRSFENPNRITSQIYCNWFLVLVQENKELYASQFHYGHKKTSIVVSTNHETKN